MSTQTNSNVNMEHIITNKTMNFEGQEPLTITIDTMSNIKPSKTKKNKRNKLRRSESKKESITPIAETINYRKSKLRLFGVKAKLKLTNTISTDQPLEIRKAKSQLKGLKKFTNEIEEIANNLFLSQTEASKQFNLLCDKLTDINQNMTQQNFFTTNLNNVRNKLTNLKDENKKYPLNLKNEFINPLNEFNSGAINKCKQLKLQLKAKKGEYDMCKRNEIKLNNRNKQKNVNWNSAKCTTKLEELQLIRNEFVSSAALMETEKLVLLSSMKKYMSSYGQCCYSQMLASKLN